MGKFNLAGISFWPQLWKPKNNFAKLCEYLEKAKEMGADVVATPEGILDGYITKDLEKNRITPKHKESKGYHKRLAEFRKRQEKLALEIKEVWLPKVSQKIAELQMHAFVNTLDHRGKGAIYNTTRYLTPEGKVKGKYDKIHADFEVVNKIGKEHVVFPTEYAKIGVLICADRQFPETVRNLALQGAQVVIINSYGMWGEGANERFIRQRAYENGVFILFCHPGESVILSPEGRIIMSTCGWENVIVRTIDPREAVGRGVFGSAAMAKTYTALRDVKKYQQRKTKNTKRSRKK